MAKLVACAVLLATLAATVAANNVDAGEVSTVIVDAPLYDTRVGADGGCDPTGCSGDLTRGKSFVYGANVLQDGDIETLDSRWSCKPELGSAGSTCSISYSLPDTQIIEELNIALSKGDERTRTIDIYVDGIRVTSWTSSGTTLDFETVPIGVSGTIIELRGVLEDSEWLSIMEVEIMIIIRDGSTLSPAPAPTSTGVLESIERIPRARSSSGRFREEELYQAKDNDISTSWTCDGSTTRNGDCEIELDLSWYRHLKEVNIALANGGEAAIDMKIVAESFSDDSHEMYVTSSGTTTAFETYEFDVFTDRIIISSHVGSDGSISIAEVEFVEEVQAGEIPVILFRPPFESEASSIDNVVLNGFEWWSESEEALDEELQFKLSTWASLTAVVLKFPTDKTYLFDLHLYTEADGGDEPFATLTGLESEDTAGWQTFDVQLDVDQTVTEVRLVMTGTGSGASGFHLRDAGFMGTRADNPTNTYYVSTTRSPFRNNPLYPDFVGDGKSDQEAIMGAICALKKASFDGVDCVGEDPAATGTLFWVFTGHICADVVQMDAAAELGRNPITLPVGNYFVDGNIFMKSGVILDGDTSEEDPNRTTIFLAVGAAGNTAIDAIIVFDGVTDAVIDEVWLEGLYDPDSSNAISAVAGLGSTAISITNCQNILHNKGWVGSMDGDAIVVRDSQTVSLDAGRFKEEFVPDRIASSRGIGLLVDTSKDVYVRRHAIFDNGGAGIHIADTTNFTFDATIGRGYEEGQGYVGSLDGQQPIEVIVESSHGVIFQDMSVRSANDPVMTVSADSSEVIFNNNGFSNVDAGTCVIQAEDPSVVTIEDDELMLVDSCYVKV